MKFFGRRSLGERGERLAAKTLYRSGYRILERNIRLAGHEVDIIAQKDDTVAFVEVKTRSSADPYDPQDNLSRKQQGHLRKAAMVYIDQRRDETLYYRFDLVTVVLPEKGKPTIEHYEDAFQM